MKVAVPDMISNSYFPVMAAVELGFFAAEGIDASLELIFPVDKAYSALREGTVDFVGGSAHSALSAFPDWKGVKLLCAQAQGMYWFLVMRSDLNARRGDVTAVKGRRIGAAPLGRDGLASPPFSRRHRHEGGQCCDRAGAARAGSGHQFRCKCRTGA
jgi:ABC-type nitrate/sulfonate/bicarbonate transport system substrate-binding protein